MDGASVVPQKRDDRIRRIESVTDAALAHLSFEALTPVLLDRVREVLGVDTAAVLLLDPSGTELVATAAQGLEEEVRQGVRIPVGRGFAGRIFAERRAVALDRVDHTTVLNPILSEKGIKSLLGVPLVAQGTTIGVLHVGTLTNRPFTDDDAQFLQLVADRVALATKSQLSEEERAASVALQRSLLPPVLPDVRGLHFAGRYAPGEQVGVGGDWYDVFTLQDDHIGVVVGDVAGHGLRAAVVMGRIRSALRAYALQSPDPAHVLTCLDDNLQHFEPGEIATALYAVFDPSLDEVRISSAGHPPPVVALPGRKARRLDVPPGPPLGVKTDTGRESVTVDVPPGAVFCLYTDGLIERRGRDLDEGLERLEHAVVADEPNRVIANVMSRLVGNEPLSDDVAVLVVERPAT